MIPSANANLHASRKCVKPRTTELKKGKPLAAPIMTSGAITLHHGGAFAGRAQSNEVRPPLQLVGIAALEQLQEKCETPFGPELRPDNKLERIADSMNR